MSRVARRLAGVAAFLAVAAALGCLLVTAGMFAN